MVTTGDHALLTPKITDFFCISSLKSAYDITVALTDANAVNSIYPESKRTAYRLKDGRYCSCNLFAFMTCRARDAAKLWQHIESKRKTPARVAWEFGWWPIIKYLTGNLTLEKGMEDISSYIGHKAGAIITPYPEAAIDVDTPDDLQLVERILHARQKTLMH
jgi:hypothetical protein